MTTTTTTPAAPDLALACVPGAIPAAERAAHFRLVHRLFTTAARERRRLPDGYAYRFDAEAFDDLARWITNERLCCPFLAFSIELAPAGGAILVRLAGPEGTHAFIDAELPALPSSPA